MYTRIILLAKFFSSVYTISGSGSSREDCDTSNNTINSSIPCNSSDGSRRAEFRTALVITGGSAALGLVTVLMIIVTIIICKHRHGKKNDTPRRGKGSCMHYSCSTERMLEYVWVNLLQ